MKITLDQAAEFFRSQDGFWILTHQSPDGDTLGSAYALCYALQAMGKQAKVLCSDPLPQKFAYLYPSAPEPDGEGQTIVSVDVADTKLLGPALSSYESRIALAIDHHPSNTQFAEKLVLDPGAAATAEIIYQLIEKLGVPVEQRMANALYTGIATDTGCFRYANTTARTHQITAALIQAGADAPGINNWLFETKSRTRVLIEQKVLETMRFFHHDQCAAIYITQQMLKETGATEEEIDGLSALPRQIEGVEIGLTLREREDGAFKVSVRTRDLLDASAICGRLGGGGHKRAAGCLIRKPLDQALEALVEQVEIAFSQGEAAR